MRRVVSDRAAQHGVARLEGVEHGLRRRVLDAVGRDLDLDLGADAGEVAQGVGRT